MATDLSFNMYFSGQSFMGVYDLGTAQSMIDHSKQTLQKVKGYAGNSAGAIAACMVLTSPGTLMSYLEDILRLSDKINNLPDGALNQNCDIINDVKLILQSHLRHDAHLTCAGRLYVPIAELAVMEEDTSPFAVSRPTEDKAGIYLVGGNRCRLAGTVVVSNFDSKEDLIEVLLAAIYQPFNQSWTIPNYKGKLWMDVSPFCVNPDGLQNIPFSHRGRLITIAPNKHANQVRPLDCFSPGSMNESTGTRPSLTNPLQMSKYGNTFYPPKRETLLNTFRLAAEDGKQFLKKWNMFERALDSYEAQNPYH
ncbi:patatin-like phospholipase domain-containing protein 4 [Apostichopus japonicus]|uniref:patatin-like phospholipase domain-containing protein 4 n=1 Tax=Stichopus japonicus TaxID=307972 RepID=UPI003AB7A3B7